jgi:hypothetical protein
MVIHGLVAAVMQAPLIFGPIAFIGGIILLGVILVRFAREN